MTRLLVLVCSPFTVWTFMLERTLVPCRYTAPEHSWVDPNIQLFWICNGGKDGGQSAHGALVHLFIHLTCLPDYELSVCIVVGPHSRQSKRWTELLWCPILKRNITTIYKTNDIFYSAWLKMSDWGYKLKRKVFEEIKSERSFPIDFYSTENLVATTAIAIWWPSSRMEV